MEPGENHRLEKTVVRKEKLGRAGLEGGETSKPLTDMSANLHLLTWLSHVQTLTVWVMEPGVC